MMGCLWANHDYEILIQLLNEDGSTFPAQVDVICGKTLTKTKTWWKAILLVRKLED